MLFIMLLLFNHPVVSDSMRPMDCSTPGLSVPHHLPKFAQVHVHCIGNAVQPSHPLTSSSPSALRLPQISIRDFSNESTVPIRRLKYWSFSFSNSPSNEYSGLISLKIDQFDLLAVQGTLRSLLQHQFEGINSSVLHLLYGPVLTTVRDHWEDHSLDYTDLCWQSNISAFQHTMFVIAFLPRSKCLLISWLQLPPTVILEPKRKSVTTSTFPLYLP